MGTLFTIIGWVLFGLIVGFIARAVVPGKDDIGILMTILLGIAGSLVGGLVFSLFSGSISLSNPVGWIGSIVFAIVLLVVYNKVTGRKRTRA